MPTWDEAAEWYLGMVNDPARGFNDLAGDTALELLGPVTGRNVLDVGCGEGHIARRLARAGAQVEATEPVATLLRAARAAEDRAPLGIRYYPDRAEHLRSIATASMAAACAVLVLHHVEDPAAALAETYRVLQEDGVLVAVIPHPWTDHPSAGWVPGSAQPRRMIGAYGREGYWSSKASVEELASVHDIGWYHRTLGTWMTSLPAAGFRLTELREPTGEQSARPDGGGPWSQLPRFLSFSAVKVPAPS